MDVLRNLFPAGFRFWKFEARNVSCRELGSACVEKNLRGESLLLLFRENSVVNFF